MSSYPQIIKGKPQKQESSLDPVMESRLFVCAGDVIHWKEDAEGTETQPVLRQRFLGIQGIHPLGNGFRGRTFFEGFSLGKSGAPVIQTKLGA